MVKTQIIEKHLYVIMHKLAMLIIDFQYKTRAHLDTCTMKISPIYIANKKGIKH